MFIECENGDLVNLAHVIKLTLRSTGKDHTVDLRGGYCGSQGF
jgi:hypothetical protein